MHTDLHETPLLNLKSFRSEFKKPALCLFYVNGASNQKRKFFFAMVFHILWLLATIANLFCLTDFLYSVHIFAAFAKAIALTTWWIIHLKRKELDVLLRSLKFMLMCSKLTTSSFTKVFLKFSPVLMIVVITAPAIVWLSLTSELTDSCVVFWNITETKRWYVITYFILMSSTQQFVNWCMPCAAAAFYICFCIETRRITRKLTENLRSKRLHSLQTRKYYKILVNLVLKLDSTLSSSILLCLTRCYMEFFRALTLYFQYSKDVRQIRYIVSAVFYSLESGILYVGIILLADGLQSDCDELRKTLLRHSDSSNNNNTCKAIDVYYHLFEDKEDFKLTAWKMFRLKKKVLFTTVTSLLSYGVIIHQLHK